MFRNALRFYVPSVYATARTLSPGSRTLVNFFRRGMHKSGHELRHVSDALDCSELEEHFGGGFRFLIQNTNFSLVYMF